MQKVKNAYGAVVSFIARWPQVSLTIAAVVLIAVLVLL
jgi:hypothetical protein